MLKTSLLVTLALLFLAVLLGAYVLVPAHRQIRAVEAHIPAPSEFDAAVDGPQAAGPVAVWFVNTATQSSPELEISHPAVVLRWADGRLFLIDTGMDRQAAEAFSAPLEWLTGADPVRTFGPVEEHLGEAVRTLRGIGFTHLHVDHTSGVTAVCEAAAGRAEIFQTTAQASLQNLHTEEGQRRVEAAACGRRVLASDPIMPVPGFPGLAVIAAGGHTPGSSIFVARSGGRTWVFAGDIANAWVDVVEDRGKGWLYSYLLVPENVGLLARWRQWLRSVHDDDTRVVVAHDLESYRDNGLRPFPEGV